MSAKTKFGTLTLNFVGLNTLKPLALNRIITGLPQLELEQSSHEILDYMAQL